MTEVKLGFWHAWPNRNRKVPFSPLKTATPFDGRADYVAGPAWRPLAYRSQEAGDPTVVAKQQALLTPSRSRLTSSPDQRELIYFWIIE